MYIGRKRHFVSGNPDPLHISTSFIERQNLSLRMRMRRLTNGFSKKIENHIYAIALNFVYYTL
jgi:IS1 family transposase